MKNVAVIGGGISGMGMAYLLHRAGHSVTLYEKAERIGGHSRTITVTQDGAKIPVDTGFIVFNEPNYPNLIALFRHLGVAVHKSDMSFAISLFGGKVEWGAQNLNAVFGQRRNLLDTSFYLLIRDVLRFNARALDAVEMYPELTLGQLIDHLRLGVRFRRDYLLPMGGAIWSCPPQQMLEFPASTFVQFFKNHGLLSLTGQHQWYTVTGGSQCYVAKLTAPYQQRIRTHCAVTSVTREDGRVGVTDSTGKTEVYDEAVFACHADETLAMLTDANAKEREILSSFKYQLNTAYLHSDTAIMPKRKRCWASWVYHTDRPGDASEAAEGISVTYWMNRLQSIDDRYPLFVTLNPATPIAPEKIINTHLFTHPVFTAASLSAQQRLPEIQGQRGSWFCGAYTRYGFHEDGLLSAVNVAKTMGIAIPWH